MTANYISLIYVIFILWVVYMTSEPPIEIVTTCWRVLAPHDVVVPFYLPAGLRVHSGEGIDGGL